MTTKALFALFSVVAPEPIMFINCLQCDSDTYPDCENGKDLVPSQCTNLGQRYCAVTKVTTFDQGKCYLFLHLYNNYLTNVIARPHTVFDIVQNFILLLSDKKNI